jgi:hypothetical protein
MVHSCNQVNCKHESLKFCSHCGKVYCEKCGKEWEDTDALNQKNNWWYQHPYIAPNLSPYIMPNTITSGTLTFNNDSAGNTCTHIKN